MASTPLRIRIRSPVARMISIAGACGGVDGFQFGETYQLAIRQPTVPSVEGVMADAPLLAKRKDRQSTRLLLSDQPTPILKPLLPHSLTLSRFASEEKCGSSDAYNYARQVTHDLLQECEAFEQAQMSSSRQLETYTASVGKEKFE